MDNSLADDAKRLAVDAKRILLRYGAPIVALDTVEEQDRIDLARDISKTPLPEREARLRQLLEDGGHLRSEKEEEEEAKDDEAAGHCQSEKKNEDEDDDE